MIITTDRSSLDEALKGPDNTFLIVFGQNNKTAQKIHEHGSDPDAIEEWNISVLIENLDVLSAKERAAWYTDDTHCTTLSRPKDNGKRIVVEQIEFDELCAPKGNVSTRRINAAFGRADAA